MRGRWREHTAVGATTAASPILLDMTWPKMSGPEVLRRLKIPVVVVVSTLSQKNREKLLGARAEQYREKNSLTPGLGINRLPEALEDVICRIHRNRGIAFSNIPLKGEGFIEHAAGVLPPKDWRRPGVASPTETPRTSGSRRARTDRRLPENSATAEPGYRHISKLPTANP
jgi:hypothetical protein